MTLLAGVNAVASQDLTNTDPFVNVDTGYEGDVLSNTSTIDNNSPGNWTGNILTNAGTITNNTGATWRGEVLSNTHIIDNHGTWLDGTVTLNSATLTNYLGASWTGDVTNTGDLKNYGSWTGDVIGNSLSRIENIGPGAVWVGDIVSNHDVITNFSGSIWRGDILANGGDGHYYVDNLGSWFGDVMTNVGTIYNTDGTWTGDVYGNTGGIANNFVTPANGAEWVGDVLGNNGLISNYGVWTGDVVDNPGDIANFDHWIGDLANRGRIINTGVWTGDVVHTGTFFWAENQIDGNFDNRGWLQLTGDLAITKTLTNSGRLQLTHDGELQTLSAAGIVLSSDSSYEIDITAAGTSDRIVVSGAATLGGTVNVSAAPGAYGDTVTYTILSAASLEGTFAGLTTDLAFFAARLNYDDTDVDLTLLRNDQGFASVGTTPNQMSVGTTIEAFGAGNAVYDAVLWLTEGDAGRAFDSLSGEAYASSKTAYVQNAHLLTDIVTGRIDQSFDAPQANEAVVMSYAEGPAFVAINGRGIGIWGRAYGAYGETSSDGDTAGMDIATGGIVGGIDGMLGDWRAGLMLHAGATANEWSRLSSSSDSTDYGFGAYGGRQWGNTRLSLGASYTRHDIDSHRVVAFPGFTDNLSADYAAGTAQVFGALSHEIDLGEVTLTPYTSIAYVRHDTDDFSEAGGASALSGTDSTIEATFTTIGLATKRAFHVGDILLTTEGKLGWRHAFADTATSLHGFAGGADFAVFGAPIADDTIVLSAGLSLDVSVNNTLGLTYDGQIGTDAQTHAVMGAWAAQF